MNVVETLQFGTWSGGEAVALAVSEYLLSQGVQVSFTVPFEGPVTEVLKEKNIPYDLVALERIFQLGHVKDLVQVLRERKADICHIHGCEAVETLAPRAAAQLPSCKSLVHAHIKNTFAGSGLKTWVQKQVNKKAMALTDAVVAVSKATALDYQKQGYGEEKMHVVWNGLPGPTDEPKEDWSALPGYQSGDLKILQAARLEPYKGQLELLESAATLKEKGVRLHLHFLGKASDAAFEDTLKRKVQQLNIEDQVVWGGFSKNVGGWISAADICALPSYREGLPMFLIEAMWRNTPSVAARVDGVPEVVVDGVTGLLVHPQDVPALTQAITQLTDPKIRETMGQAGHDRASQYFSQEAMGRGVYALMQKMVAGA